MEDPVALRVRQHHAGLDRPRVEGGDVEDGAYVGMAGVHPLETAVTPEPVDHVGPDPPADPRRALQDAHV
jgi:hypothetical protein